MTNGRAKASADQRSDLGHASFIYFFSYSDQQRIKIGSSTDPRDRVRQQDDGGLRLLAVVPGTEEQEKALHAYFDDQRQEGQREVFWWDGEVRNFVEWLMSVSFAAHDLTTDALAASWAPPDWLPWMQSVPRQYDDQGVLVFPGFDWAAAPPSNTSDEYYTLAADIAPARALLGEIELDVASHANANRVVKAEKFFTIHDEALHIPWTARTVWMNPPYSLSRAFTQKLVKHHEAGSVGEAVAFLSARSVGDRWFHDQDVWRYPLCFRKGRAQFDGPDGKGSSAQFGHMWLYLGPQVDRFQELFSPLGAVVVKRGLRP